MVSVCRTMWREKTVICSNCDLKIRNRDMRIFCTEYSKYLNQRNVHISTESYRFCCKTGALDDFSWALLQTNEQYAIFPLVLSLHIAPYLPLSSPPRRPIKKPSNNEDPSVPERKSSPPYHSSRNSPVPLSPRWNPTRPFPNLNSPSFPQSFPRRRPENSFPSSRTSSCRCHASRG